MTFDIDIPACEERLGYRFKEPRFLINALTHSSIKTADYPSNERLEFLGDAILGQEISLQLYKAFPDYDEGQLTQVKSVVVSRTVIGRVCSEMGMDTFVMVGKGIRRKQFPVSLYANIFEALIAVIYLDGGIRPTRKFIRLKLSPEIDAVIADTHAKNYKSLLQHVVQKQFKETPAYIIVEEAGPDHMKTFIIQVIVAGKPYGKGSGFSKKEAEQNAAENSLHLLKQHPKTSDDNAEELTQVD